MRKLIRRNSAGKLFLHDEIIMKIPSSSNDDDGKFLLLPARVSKSSSSPEFLKQIKVIIIFINESH
jgi:hypothetical protein